MHKQRLGNLLLQGRAVFRSVLHLGKGWGGMITVSNFMLCHTNRNLRTVLLLWVWKIKEKAKGSILISHQPPQGLPFNRLRVYMVSQSLCMVPELSQSSEIKMEVNGGGRTVVIMALKCISGSLSTCGSWIQK